ncbi:MAG: amino acid adenylation domain-containing protein [Paucimonas sp.]|jgi:amino acid adenylation domain-containing protein|nr:amino acid adenylation domain-containing protein [Paucimonas sp.]
MPDLRPNPSQGLSYRAEQPIFEAFVRQAARTPEAIAVVADSLTCSYQQLEQVSRSLARHLLELGARAGDRVVIVSDRSVGLIHAVLGASRAGLVFSVADVAYPPARIEQIVEVLAPACILVCGAAQVTLESRKIPVLRVADAPAEALGQFAGEPLPLPVVDPQQPAYITFTSGSTGEPKGVVTHHAPLVHFVEWHVRRHGFTCAERFSLVSGLGHDPVYRDLFTPLSIGARVVCPSRATLTDPAALASWIGRQGVTVMHLTPPLGKLIETGASMSGQVLERLRYLFWGGDALSLALYRQMQVIAPNARGVNFYGTTETPQAMAFQLLEEVHGRQRFALGKGIDDAQLLVVNSAGRLVAEGEEGEILIRSPYLSLGYWRDPALSAQKFVANPFSAEVADRCYRTGDLGTYLADGSVDFLGRADGQVKVRGHRVELGEIEQAIVRQPGIKQCVVLANRDNTNVKLVAYCVAAQPPSTAMLRQALGELLPDYMVPAVYVFLPAIPLTPNGKIDKRALPAPAFNAVAGQDLSPLGVRLGEAWARILQVPAIDPDLSFVEHGGDSMSFVQASMVLQQLIGHLPQRWELVPVRELVEQGTVAQRPRPALEMPVLLRMLAIILIVVGHFGLFSRWVVTGETSTLFLISGISLARFQLKAIEARGDARMLLRSVAGIALPTVLYTLLIQVLFDHFHWQSLLLVSNWFPTEQVGYFNYWYIEVLVQMILIIGLVLSVPPLCRRLLGNPFRNLALAAGALLLADIVITLWIYDARPLFNRVPQHFLAIMVLGMAVHFADSPRRKWLVSGLAVLVIAEIDIMGLLEMDWQALASRRHVDLALPAVLALIWIRAVPVPALLAKVGAVIASSTLFIYLTHFQFQSVARRVSGQPLVAVALAITGGVLVGYCWNKALRLVLARWGRGRKKREADAVEPVA